jgi:cytochrome P450 family 4 subfamily F polypeptide 22
MNMMFSDSDDSEELTPGVTLLSATVTTAVAVIVTYTIHWVIQRKRFIDRVNQLPGPPMNDTLADGTDSVSNNSVSGHPWLANLGPLLATTGTIPNHPEIPQVVALFEKWSRDYADKGLFRIWAFHPYRVPFARTSVTIVCPDLIRQLLDNPVVSRKLVKERRVFHLAAPVVGSSLLGLPDNAEWKHQRKMTAPGFHQKVLDEACRTATHLMTHVIFPVWDKHPNSAKAVEAVELSTRLTLEVLGNVAFSYPFGGLRAYEEEDAEKEKYENDDSLFANYQALLTTIAKRLRSHPLASWMPTRENVQFRKHSRRLDSAIEKIVKDRLQKEIESEQQPVGSTKEQRTTTSKDLLSQLLLKDEDGIRLPFKYIHGNVRMFLFAGHDTTASSLAYALWELAKSPEIQQRLRQEVDQLFLESVPDGENLSCMQLMQLRYLDAVVKETLRLHAPVGVARTAANDITLKKGDETFVIPKSASIYVFPRYTHISKEHWPDRPEEFVPDRFFDVDAASASSNRRNGKSPAYLPFSIGPRNCLGQNLANVELKSILAHVVRRYMLKPNEAALDPIPVFLLTIKPHSVLLDFERRPDVK